MLKIYAIMKLKFETKEIKMAKGFWNFLKNANKVHKETNNKESENYINVNPTEEQLKDNKNGKKAIILSIIACLLLIGFVALIVLFFKYNLALGFVSILLLIIPARLQMSAVKKAKKQLNINGKGKIKFLLVKFVFPTISAIVSVAIILLLIGLILK